jgi:DNA replication and repair protein RecF
MVIEKLLFSDFRNYSSCEFDPNEGVNVFFGENGVGKTNLLEAIYLASVGESFKAKKIEEMVRFEQELGRVVVSLGNKEKLEVVVTAGVVSGKKTSKRIFRIDGANKRRGDFVGNLKTVLFRPEDMEFMGGSPAFRRNMIDKVLIQVDAEYARSLASYGQALRRRNKLLDMIRRGEETKYSLAFWDEMLIKHGGIISEKRLEFTGFLNNLWKRSDLFSDLSFHYDQSVISGERLKQYEMQEVLVGYTLVGPHKDDFKIFFRSNKNEDKDLSIYGSRGEQRMGVLALKMGEVYFLERDSNEKIVLLLDDVLSELDEKHRKEVLRLTLDRQVFLTTANKGEIKRFKKAKVFEL